MRKAVWFLCLLMALSGVALLGTTVFVSPVGSVLYDQTTLPPTPAPTPTHAPVNNKSAQFEGTEVRSVECSEYCTALVVNGLLTTVEYNPAFPEAGSTVTTYGEGVWKQRLAVDGQVSGVYREGAFVVIDNVASTEYLFQTMIMDGPDTFVYRDYGFTGEMCDRSAILFRWEWLDEAKTEPVPVQLPLLEGVVVRKYLFNEGELTPLGVGKYSFTATCAPVEGDSTQASSSCLANEACTVRVTVNEVSAEFTITHEQRLYHTWFYEGEIFIGVYDPHTDGVKIVHQNGEVVFAENNMDVGMAAFHPGAVLGYALFAGNEEVQAHWEPILFIEKAGEWYRVEAPTLGDEPKAIVASDADSVQVLYSNSEEGVARVIEYHR